LEEEKRKILERQKKFGVITEIPEIEEEKKRQRLQRFGDTSNEQEVCIILSKLTPKFSKFYTFKFFKKFLYNFRIQNQF
jgi:hypothetical protein